MEKDFNISERMTSFAAIVGELAKCVLLCCRCHREVHDGWHTGYLAGEDRGADWEEDEAALDDSADLDFPTLLEESTGDPVLAVVAFPVVGAGAGGGAVATVDPNHVPVTSRTLDEVHVGAAVAGEHVRDKGDGPADAGGQLGMPGGPGPRQPADGLERRADVDGIGAHGGTSQYTESDQTLDDFWASLAAS